LVTRADGSDEMVYKGLETVRTDWTPLAQQFQQQLYQRIFKRQPYQHYVRDCVSKTLFGHRLLPLSGVPTATGSRRYIAFLHDDFTTPVTGQMWLS